MPTGRIICFFIIWGTSLLAGYAEQPLDPQTESLIEQLPSISQIGYGYSAMFSGTQFLPDTNSDQVGTLVLGSQAPANSLVLEKIVKRGILAVPALLKHLDDKRETKIAPVSGMMWIQFANEYDFNHRLRKKSPAGVNKDEQDMFGTDYPSSHTITVGDLCFVALGQIVNRNFSATRYQPTGGLIVNSPTYSTQLCMVVRTDSHNLNETKHRELLIQDFEMPDYEDRQSGHIKDWPVIIRDCRTPRFGPVEGSNL